MGMSSVCRRLKKGLRLQRYSFIGTIQYRKFQKNFTPKLIMAIVTRFIAGETRNVIDFKNF